MQEITNKPFCPLLQKDCIGLDCNWFIKMQGKHPQSDTPIDHWDCAVKWLPVLLIENAQVSRGTGAAVESMRNELVKRMDAAQERVRIAQEAQKFQRIIDVNAS